MGHRICVKLGVAVLALLAASAGAKAAPDLIIYDGHIVTVDGKFSTAQAASIAGGKFVVVGSNKKVLATAGPSTQKIDLHGQTVLPGFNDTHNHQLSFGERFANAVDLTDIHSIADIQNQLSARIKTSKPGEWIGGSRGWWEYELKDGRLPNRFDLDKIASDNPVVIPGPHYVIANSLALKLAGITKDSKDPQGGEIRKDPKTGEPTGELFDRAGAIVSKFLPDPTPQERQAGVLHIMAVNNSNGLTSIGEPMGSMDDMNLYRRLYDEGKLTTRVDFAFRIDIQEPIEQIKKDLADIGPPGHEYGDGMIRSDEVGETELDGAELTALLREDFPDRPGYKGMFVVKQPQFNEVALAVDEAGYRMRPHAVGDGAIDEALAAYAYADAHKSIVGRRWMIDHDFLIMPDMYPAIKKFGLILNSQYMHDAQLGELILKAWHRPLADKMENFKDWLAAGIMFTGGSDGPVSYHAVPLYEIYGEITRKTLWGGVLGADQGITREQAIRSVTSWSAYTTFEEKVKGSIEPGKYADFVILSDDILKVPADKIKDIKVLATVLGGKTIYGTLQ